MKILNFTVQISQKNSADIFRGFTMAEVLITLAVIGIVASMTLPALINKIHLTQYIAQLKSDYSILAQAHSHVRITTVAPYYINTGMFEGVHSRIFPILDPERTSRKILRAIERNRDFRGIPLSFHLIRFCQGILPVSWFDFIFGRGFGIFSAMDNFTGRKPKKQ